MILFLFKKAFWEGWDNIGQILLVNTGFFLGNAALLALALGLRDSSSWGLVPLVLGVPVNLALYGGGAAYLHKVVNYKSLSIKGILNCLWTRGLPSALYALPLMVGLFVLLTALRFYALQESFWGLVGLALTLWITLFISLALQFFFPILNGLDPKVWRALKKSFVLLFDNTAVALALGAGTLGLWGLTLTVVGGFFTGPGGIIFLQESCLRLLIIKYDYLEEHPEGDRRWIPWEELLVQEKERLGKRTLGNTIFPWKDRDPY